MRLIAGASVPLVVGAISVLMGIAGIAGTRAWVRRATGTMRDRSYFFWSLGIFGLLPAWLVVFVYLIPTNVSVGGHGRGPLGATAVFWVCSIALGLTGAIMSEARLRHRNSTEGPSPDRAWFLGLWTMLPAWLALLLGLVVTLVGAWR
jgi:hypothetical protein